MSLENTAADLIALPYAPATKFWEAVRKAESNKQLLAVCESSCGGGFPLFDFLTFHQVTCQQAEGQHVHAEIQAKGSGFELGYLMGSFSSASKRGEFAAAKAEDVRENLQSGTATFQYAQTHFRVHVFTYHLPRGGEDQLFVLAWDHDREKGKQLVADVKRWASQLRQELWVYNGVKGGWRKDKAFYKAVQAARAEDLVLTEHNLSHLQRDTTTFFANQALYKELGIAWKRGILLLGPPGNGKTGVIKVLAKSCAEQGVATLYVQTAETRVGPEYGMTAIFEKARAAAPCMLILEDIETFVKGAMRTFLLNQLDGIESNDGVLVIATANDVTQLDPAILERPSRFDTKYDFSLPDDELRNRFIVHWLTNKIGSSRLALKAGALDALVDELVTRTKGWTFAFLKELFVSMLLAHATLRSQNGKKDEVGSIKITKDDLLTQVEVLQTQIQAKPENSAGKKDRAEKE